MAHYAQLDENNVVTQVIVVHNNELVVSKQTTVNEDGSVSVSVIESEDKGIEFCKSLFGANTNWVQTSYNNNFRGKYAGIGDTYDTENNVFVRPVIEIVTPTIEPVVMGETTHTIQTLTSSNVSALSSMHIAALDTSDLQSLDTFDLQSLNTSDLQSLTTTGL